MMAPEQMRSRRVVGGTTNNGGQDSPSLDSNNNNHDQYFNGANNISTTSPPSTKSGHTYGKLSGSKLKTKPTFWEKLGGGLHLTSGETRVLAGLILLGSVVRFWRIDRPTSVV